MDQRKENLAKIKLLRASSALKEVISQALGNLGDELLKGLCVTDVECKRGKYDAFIYLDKMMLDEKEQDYVLRHLKLASGAIEEFCVEALGWYKAPKLHFKFDDSLERQNKMDALFKKVQAELEKGKK